MTKKDSLDNKQKIDLERLYVIGLYIWFAVAIGSIYFGNFWMSIKIVNTGVVIFAILGLFLPKEAIDRIVLGKVPNDTPSKKREEVSQNADWDDDYKPVHYDEDDTYDNFYMQREDEYRQEYGDEYEDAIDEAWSEHQRNKRAKKR